MRSSSSAGLTRAAAAAATMRDTASRSSGGSVWSSEIARSSTGSRSGSVMCPSCEPSSQIVTRPLHPHFQCGLLHPGDAFDLVVRKAFDVVQQENLSIVFGHFGQRLTHVVAPLVLVFRRRCVRRGQPADDALIVDVRDLVPATHLVGRPTAVAKDMKQPGLEAVPLLIPR